jgi:Protein of unknown function (DUF3551)
MSNTFVDWTSRVAIAGRIAERRRLQNWNELSTPGDYHLPFGKTEARVAEEGPRPLRLTMLRMIFAAVVALVTVVFGVQPAKAYEAPWCAVTSGGDGDMHWDCQYRSIEECRPNVLAGNRGWCNPNPYFVAPYRPTEHRPSRQHHTRPQ